MSSSPYAPPKANVLLAASGISSSTPIAGKGARFLNLVLDTAFSYAIIFAAAASVGAAGYGAWLVGSRSAAWGFELAISLAYYVVLEGYFGWTFAKLITGTRVVDAHGGRADFPCILGRTLARIVPFEPLSFLGKTGIGWHDRWSSTRVVSIRATSGATLADSFQEAAPVPTTQAFVPSDGPPAWCPNCSQLISADTTKCRCGADFTSDEGWKPLPERP